MPVVPIRADTPQAQVPTPPDVYTLMAAAQMHSEGRLIKQVAETIPDDAYMRIESVLTEHARGNISAAQVHSSMEPGYKVDLRRGRYAYEVTDPDGDVHEVQP